MKEYPDIYVLRDIPSLGELGRKTEVIFRELCKTCKRREVEYKYLSYRFGRWNGEDLISVAGTLIFVSERLKNELDEKGIKNISYSIIENEKESYFKIGKNAYQKSLPNFYRLTIHSKADGPEIWWQRAHICPECNDQKWDITIEGVSSTISSDPFAHYTPRKVYKTSWNGEDVFNLMDIGLPIATQSFVDRVNSFGIKYEFPPAEWV